MFLGNVWWGGRVGWGSLVIRGMLLLLPAADKKGETAGNVKKKTETQKPQEWQYGSQRRLLRWFHLTSNARGILCFNC